MSNTLPTGTSMATDTELRASIGPEPWPVRLIPALLVAAWAGTAHAGTWRLSPEVAVSETYSTNLNMAGEATAVEGVQTNIVPRLRLDARGARMSGFLDYRRDESYSPGHSDLNDGRNLLSSFATVEAIDSLLYLDASASVVQRDRSLFSPNTVATTGATQNQREMRVVEVSPYILGRAFGATDYSLRYTVSDARSAGDRSNDATLVPTRVDQWIGSLRTQAGQASLGWFADAHADRVANDVVGTRSDTRYRGGIIFPVMRHLHVLLSGGRERTDYATGSNVTSATPGVGFEWRPSQHTEATGMRERRSFGHGHDLSVTYRTARTVWRYLDVKDAAVLPMGLSGFNRGSVYDLMSDLLSTSIADPVAREQAARQRAEQVGPIGGVVDAGGVSSSRIFIDRTRQASAVLLGTRSAFTLLFQDREQHLLAGQTAVVTDDFSLSPDIRDRSAMVSWVHRLTPMADFNVSLLHLKRTGLSADSVGSSQKSGTVGLNFGLSQTVRASVAVRATNFVGAAGGETIQERAVVGTLIKRY